jgi:N-acetyl-anhydromuramoyl-L-alanine amidase
MTKEPGTQVNPNIKAEAAVTIFPSGIELEGTDKTPYTDTQYVKLAEVTQSLFRSYPRLLPERIVGHGDIAPGRKTDPGPSFDWTAYRSLLQGLRG